MDKQEIIEGNILIAEFMGGIRWSSERNGELNKIKMTQNYFPDKMLTCKIDKLEYHSSWDWLMPVIEKIDKLGYDTMIIHCITRRENKRSNKITCRIEDHYYPNPAIEIEVEAEIKINATWQAVIQFIKGYNSQKQ